MNSLGFCNEKWVAAVTRQASTLQHICNLYYSAPQAELAQKLCGRTIAKKVFFCNSGAEAIEGMIKAARKYGADKYGRERYKIITLVNSFHGRTITALAATGQEEFHQKFLPLTDGFDYVLAGDLDDLRDKLDGTVCGVMMEMIQGEGGVIPLDKDFVVGAAKLCAENDVLFLDDEVQAGVGRSGKFLCHEHYGIEPDVVSLAKGLGGGLPIGAVLLGEKCEQVFAPGDHGSTFGGNPVVCAGANAVLDQIDQKLLDEVLAKGEYIANQVRRMPHVAGVVGKGLMLGIAFDGLSSKSVSAACLEKGLIVMPAKEKVRMLPPLTITYEEIETGLKILSEVLSEI